jgi:hypothetical protein
MLIDSNTTDAQVWAEEFCRIFDGYVITYDGYVSDGGDDIVDEGTMIGWFANAIEVGRAAGYADGHEAG